MTGLKRLAFVIAFIFLGKDTAWYLASGNDNDELLVN
jgi:hypothetical protein